MQKHIYSLLKCTNALCRFPFFLQLPRSFRASRTISRVTKHEFTFFHSISPSCCRASKHEFTFFHGIGPSCLSPLILVSCLMNLDRLVDAKTKLNKKFTNLQLQHVTVHIVSRALRERTNSKEENVQRISKHHGRSVRDNLLFK